MELQRVRKEAFRITSAIYIKPLASMSLLVFRKSSESSKEERDVIFFFEALKRVTTVEGLKKHFEALEDIFHLLHYICHN
jgi:hypothetical protein